MSFLISFLPNLWAYLDVAVSPIYDTVAESSYSPAIDLTRLASASDLTCIPLPEYAYDPLPALPRYAQQRRLPLPSRATAKNNFLSINAVQLDPLSAGLPYRSSFSHIYASRHWKSNLSEAINLLKLLASDNSASDIEADHGITLSKLANKAFQPGKKTAWCLPHTTCFHTRISRE